MKESPVDDIIAAVRSAMAGDVYMSEDVRRIYETRKGVKGLSPRENEVLVCVSRGQNNREIGASLGISENSVKMHLKRIFFKLGATDRTEAVELAVRRGFISRG
jgi:DNA-binding NarL/FixJ family response regulator